MFKCECDIEEFGGRHKGHEGGASRRLIARRLSFEELTMRDRHQWLRVETAAELAAVAREVKRELVRGDYARFEAWASANLGMGLARAAGLTLHQPRLVISA